MKKAKMLPLEGFVILMTASVTQTMFFFYADRTSALSWTAGITALAALACVVVVRGNLSQLFVMFACSAVMVIENALARVLLSGYTSAWLLSSILSLLVCLAFLIQVGRLKRSEAEHSDIS